MNLAILYTYFIVISLVFKVQVFLLLLSLKAVYLIHHVVDFINLWASYYLTKEVCYSFFLFKAHLPFIWSIVLSILTFLLKVYSNLVAISSSFISIFTITFYTNLKVFETFLIFLVIFLVFQRFSDFILWVIAQV